MSFNRLHQDSRVQFLYEEHRKWLANDPIHRGLQIQANSLPLFNDEFHGSSEHREWQLIGATQQIPIIHAVKQSQSDQSVASQSRVYICPMNSLPISSDIYLAPNLHMTLKSQFPLTGDDLSDVPKFVKSYARFLTRYDGLFMGQPGNTFSAKFGVSHLSAFGSMLVRINSRSSPRSERFPLYLSADATARAVGDSLHCTQSSIKLHCLPFSGLDNRLRLLSVEAKQEVYPSDDRWRGRFSYTHELSAPQPDQRILSNQDFVPPAFTDASQQVSDMPLSVTISSWATAAKSKLSAVRERYFPDLFDGPPPVPVNFQMPASSFKFASPPRSLVPWRYPTHLTFAISSPLAFIPHTVEPLPAYRLGDSQLSHYTRDMAASIGMSIYPNAQTVCNVEAMANNEAQSTFITINSGAARSDKNLYVNAGAVKHKAQPNIHLHVGFGLSVGSRW